MTAQIRKGFTLIELLIVIAILGVLAVVVLVAINPVQQLARTRDAGRISSVSQIGHAVESYYTSHDGTYPANLSLLVTTGELNNIPSQVTNTLTSYCTGNTLGWCYASQASGPAAFAVWSRLEADSNLNASNGTTTCTGTAFTAYLSQLGRSCTVCSAPTATTNSGCAN